MKNIFLAQSANRLAYFQHSRQTLQLAYPIMLSQLGHIMVNVADSMFVGQLGGAALAAVSLATSVFSLLLVAGLGFSFGLTPLVAAAAGQNRIWEAAYYFRHSFMLNLIIGLALGLMGFWSGFILEQLGQDPKVVVLAKPFLQLLLFSMPFIMIFQSFKQCIEGLSNTRTAMLVSIGANLLNLLLNYILVFGKFGFAPLGISGSGIASLIARIMMAAAMFAWLSRQDWFVPFKNQVLVIRFSKAAFIKLIKLGAPISLQMLLEVGAFAAAVVMAGWLGVQALAAHQIAINLASVVYMAASGLGAAATVRVSSLRGQGKFEDMRRAGFSAMLLAVLMMCGSSLMFVLLRYQLPYLYNDDIEVVNLAASLLIVAAFFQVSDGVQVAGLGALRGLTDVLVPTLINFLAYWIIGLPLGWLLALQIGVVGIWYGLSIGLGIAAILLFWRFKHLSRKIWV